MLTGDPTEPRDDSDRIQDRPDPQWIRGKCPNCGDDLVSNLYHIAGRGYFIRWECWSSLKDTPTCDYKKML